tara:strand:+ start:5401 stop:5631 length:231 start_codon:yes stop_codon:yes gene_type:complete
MDTTDVLLFLSQLKFIRFVESGWLSGADISLDSNESENNMSALVVIENKINKKVIGSLYFMMLLSAFEAYCDKILI